MSKKISNYYQKFLKWLRKTLADKSGDFPLGRVKPECYKTIEREIVINNTRVHIRSIFTGQTRLDEAMKEIIPENCLKQKRKF